jgi:hypothetical protein
MAAQGILMNRDPFFYGAIARRSHFVPAGFVFPFSDLRYEVLLCTELLQLA